MPEKDREAPHRRRAAKLVRRGLTPRVVTDAMANPDQMAEITRHLSVKQHEVEWLAERWPVQV